MSAAVPVEDVGVPYAIVEIRSWEELATAMEDWERWLAARHIASPFLRLDWLQAWWDSYGAYGQLLILAARSADGRLDAFAPLYLARVPAGLGTNVRVLRMVGDCDQEYGDGDGLDFAAASATREAFGAVVAGWMMRNRDAWDVCALNNILVGAGSAACTVQYLGATGWVRRQRHVPRLIVEFPEGGAEAWDRFLAGRPSRLRKEVARANRRAAAIGAVEVACCREPAELIRGLQAVAILHGDRQRRQGRVPVFDDPRRMQFYRRLAALPGNPMRLTAWVVTVAGRPVAAQAGIHSGSTYFSLVAGFDGGYAALSPGTLIRARVYPMLMAEGVRSIDFLSGDVPFKRQWADREDTTGFFIIAAPRSRGAAYLRAAAARRAVTRVARRVLPRSVRRALGRTADAAALRRDPLFLDSQEFGGDR
jgi:CelD/BcsL family acetyltransferase involved in cellulose biosynthesis